MSMTSLNTDCVKHLFKFLSKKEVSIFSEVFPGHQQAVELFWSSIFIVDLSQMPASETEAFLANVRYCSNVQILLAEGPMPYKITGADLQSIADHCPSLKLVDITGIELYSSFSVFLKSCPNLKRLNLCIPMAGRGGAVPELLLSDNAQLKTLSIMECKLFEDTMTNLWLGEDFPHLTINKYGIISLTRLYTTGLTFMRAVTDNQRSLVKFETNYGDDNYLEGLFSNNPLLKDVAVKIAIITGSCLRSLPETIKHLNLAYCYRLDPEILMECFQKWDLESLVVDLRHKLRNFLEDMVATLPTLQNLTIRYDHRRYRTLEALQNLKQLKSLKLLKLEDDHSAELKEIIDSCLDLEELEIAGLDIGFSEDLNQSIAALPKLKEIRFNCQCLDTLCFFVPLTAHLSRVRTLTAATLICYSPDFGLTDEHVLMLIRGCSALMVLQVIARELTEAIIPQMKEVLDQQENRTTILIVILHDPPFSLKEESSHPLLKVHIMNEMSCFRNELVQDFFRVYSIF